MPKPVFSCFGTRTLELPHFERIADRFQTDSARFFHICSGRFGLIFKTTGVFLFSAKTNTQLGGNHYDRSRDLLRQNTLVAELLMGTLDFQMTGSTIAIILVLKGKKEPKSKR